MRHQETQGWNPSSSQLFKPWAGAFLLRQRTEKLTAKEQKTRLTVEILSPGSGRATDQASLNTCPISPLVK